MKSTVLLAVYIFIFCNVFSQKLVLATYQYAENNRIANIQPLADYLSQALKQPVETKSYATVHLFIQGIQNNEVDIALINTFGYLLLDASKQPYSMQPYCVLKVKDGTQDNYKTCFIARKDFTVDSILDIKKAASKTRLGLVAVGSTSGNLVPRLRLNAAGIDNPEQQFASVAYMGNHKTTTDAVLDGRIDAGAVGSTEYFAAMADPQKAPQLKLLWLSPEIPLGPVLLHNRLKETVKTSIKQLLLDLHNANPGALEAVKAGWSEAKQAEKYISMDAGYYDSFKGQLGSRESMEKILKQFAN